MTNNAKVESRSPTHDSGTRADWIKTGRRVREFAPALGSTVREVIVTLDDGTEARMSAVEVLYHKSDTEAVH